MRVVVVGASGNVGSAVLRAFREAEDIEAVTAVARRIPRSAPPAPFDAARWVSIDVSGEDRTAVVTALAETMRGADAVVQLAWAIQPSHQRDYLRRVNVEGASRVLEAAREAGITNVVVASSSGAYSPAHDDAFHDESWPTEGHPTCEYSVDKADVESLLDEHERDHPEVTITRLRPALIFQRTVGAEIVRYFMGPLVPQRLLDGKLPALPWPEDLRLQVVHADDVAAAYLAAVRAAPGGAFNIAAEGVLRAPDAARVMAGGRTFGMPVPAVRAAVSAAWNARVLPVSPGWIDMASGAPLMDTRRAREELGWEPTHHAVDVLEEIVDGMARNVGDTSPPLRP